MTLLLHDGSRPDHHVIKANHLNKELGNAIEVIKLNTKLYPNSTNTYDSYSELLVNP